MELSSFVPSLYPWLIKKELLYLYLSMGTWHEESVIVMFPLQEPLQGRFDAPARPRKKILFINIW